MWRVRASAVDAGASVCWRHRIRSHRFHPPPCRWGSSRAAQKWRTFALFHYLIQSGGFCLRSSTGLPPLTSYVGKASGVVLRTRYSEGNVVVPRNFVRKEIVGVSLIVSFEMINKSPSQKKIFQLYRIFFIRNDKSVSNFDFVTDFINYYFNNLKEYLSFI